VFRRVAEPGCCQSGRGTTRDLALTLEDLVRTPVRRSRSAGDRRTFTPSLLPWDCSPLRRSQPEESTSRHGVFPRGRPAALTVGRLRSSHPHSRSGGPAVPRRGLPHPLRSASAVSHDPGGLLLLGPGGVFRPLTPLGFGSLLPAACLRSSGPRTFLPGARPRGPYRGSFHASRGGRVFVLEAPGRLRIGQLPKHPSSLRGHRSHSRGSDSGFRLPGLAPCRLRALTTEVVIRPDCRSLQSSSEDVDLRATAAANRRGLPARPHVGVASPARADHVPGMSRGAVGLAGDESARVPSRRAASPRTRLRSRPTRLSTIRPFATCQLGPDCPLPIPKGRSRVAGAAGDEDSINCQ
jgi:hypothetical protein